MERTKQNTAQLPDAEMDKGPLAWKDRLSRDVLEFLYITKGYTYARIAAEYGCSTNTVQRLMNMYDMPRRRRGNPFHLQGLVEMHQAGMSNAEIAAHFRCSRATVAARLRKLGIGHTAGPMREIPNEIKQRIARAYQSGNGLTFIAKTFGYSIWAVQCALRSCGVDLRRGRPRSATNYKEIRYLYVEKGWTTTKIAELFHVKGTTISMRLKEMGIQLRGRCVGLDNMWLRSRWEQGCSVQQMADESGYSYHTIRKRLIQMGLHQVHPQPHLDAEGLRKQYQSGQYTYHDLAKLHQCEDSQVRRAIQG